VRALVTGAGGFIGGFLVGRLIADGWHVRAVDSKPVSRWRQHFEAAYSSTMDMRDPSDWRDVRPVDRVFHLAANMGGIGYITGHRLDCGLSTGIDLNVIDYCRRTRPERLFFSSSACVYPGSIQLTPDLAPLAESMAWPADPEPGYGLQKLYTEELLRFLREDDGIETRVARYHTVYGPCGTWKGGREKAPAALCRKVAQAVLDGSDSIEVWGDGEQTRTYTWVEDCVEGTLRLTDSDHPGPVNIGSTHLVSINELAALIMQIAGVDLALVHVDGPQGVRGRNSDNTLCRSVLGWEPSTPLAAGMAATYHWIADQLRSTLP
jgi:GDP-D-mannose 3',5'-epimerase